MGAWGSISRQQTVNEGGLKGERTRDDGCLLRLLFMYCIWNFEDLVQTYASLSVIQACAKSKDTY